MVINRSDLEKIAALARLRLDEREAERLTRDCQAILAYFEAIREVSRDAELPTGSGQSTPLRKDRVASDPLEGSLADMAPLWREGYFVLPRLPAMDGEGFEDGSSGRRRC